jgi:hypothetical protein
MNSDIFYVRRIGLERTDSQIVILDIHGTLNIPIK